MPERVRLQDLARANRRARRGKKPSADMARFQARAIDGLLHLQDQLNAGTWSPGKPTCMVARQPKAREIHAPPFQDRVVHHLIVPPLEALYEPRFIHDSYANRKGKGLLKAVQRLQRFVRQVHSGQGGGYYLKLDIRNFFYTINRETLWAMIKRAMQTARMPMILQRAVHAALRGSPLAAGVIHRASPADRALVPPHKRLEFAERGHGLPIGNLLSQFLANVYLDALDQFVKHQLKAPRYLRYVDDFVLVHQSREQLLQWQGQIETFLREQLGLRLKDERELLPLTHGIDFLGYVIHPTHTRVRRRVVSHARATFSAWARSHVDGGHIHATPAELRTGASQAASYFGHFRHANAHALEQQFHRSYPWLRSLAVKRRFAPGLEHQRVRIKL